MNEIQPVIEIGMHINLNLRVKVMECSDEKVQLEYENDSTLKDHIEKVIRKELELFGIQVPKELECGSWRNISFPNTFRDYSNIQ